MPRRVKLNRDQQEIILGRLNRGQQPQVDQRGSNLKLSIRGMRQTVSEQPGLHREACATCMT